MLLDIVVFVRLGCAIVDSRAGEATVSHVVLVRSSVNGVPDYAVSNKI